MTNPTIVDDASPAHHDAPAQQSYCSPQKGADAFQSTAAACDVSTPAVTTSAASHASSYGEAGHASGSSEPAPAITANECHGDDSAKDAVTPCKSIDEQSWEVIQPHEIPEVSEEEMRKLQVLPAPAAEQSEHASVQQDASSLAATPTAAATTVEATHGAAEESTKPLLAAHESFAKHEPTTTVASQENKPASPVHHHHLKEEKAPMPSVELATAPTVAIHKDSVPAEDHQSHSSAPKTPEKKAAGKLSGTASPTSPAKKAVESTPTKSAAADVKTTPRSSASKQSPSEESTPRSSGRQRRTVSRLSFEKVELTKSPSQIAAPEGSGAHLRDIPHVSKELNKRKSNDETVQVVHRIVYGRLGEAAKRKSNLRDFHGFPDNEETAATLHDKIAKINSNELRDICVFFNLDRSGEKNAVVDRIVEFLKSPKDLGESKPVPKRTPKKKAAGGAKSTPTKKARVASGDEESAEEEAAETKENDDGEDEALAEGGDDGGEEEEEDDDDEIIVKEAGEEMDVDSAADN